MAEETMQDKAKETLEKTKEAAEKAKEQAAEKAKEASEKAKEAAEKAKEQAKETLGKSKEAAGKAKAQAAEKTSKFLSRLALALIVLSAIGFSGCVTIALVIVGRELGLDWAVGLAIGAVASGLLLALLLKFSRV